MYSKIGNDKDNKRTIIKQHRIVVESYDNPFFEGTLSINEDIKTNCDIRSFKVF